MSSRAAGRGRGRPAPFSPAARADNAAARNRLAKERREAWARWWRDVQMVAAVSTAVDGGIARSVWATVAFVSKQSVSAWGVTRRRVLSPLRRATERRIVDPASSWLGALFGRQVERVRTRVDDVRTFGWGSRARDCHDCDIRLPRVEWLHHRTAEHGVWEPDGPRPAWSPGAEWNPQPPKKKRRPLGFVPAGAGLTLEWEGGVSPLDAARDFLRRAPALVRDARHRRTHQEWEISCPCGWSGPAKKLERHMGGCPWRIDTPRPDADKPSTPVVTTTPEVLVSSPVPVSQGGGQSAVAGTDIVESAPGTLQIHDLPPLLTAGADHARAEAQIIAAAMQRCANAEGADTELSQRLARALTAQLAVAAELEGAQRHSAMLADMTPDFRTNGGQTPAAAAVAVSFQRRGGFTYAVAPGTDVVVSHNQLQIHDVPPLLEAARAHIQAEVESLLGAFDRIRTAEGVDNTISGHMSRAATHQMTVEQEFGGARNHAENLASVVPDFRRGVSRVGR